MQHFSFIKDAQLNSNIFDIFCLRERFIVDVDCGTVFFAIGESDMG
jgi:hypothetical protein